MSKRARVNWRGYIPAITTPFDADGRLNLKALGELVEWLHAEGMHGLVVAGTTGEWHSLSSEERRALFDAVGSQMKGKLPLLAGCTAYTADKAIERAAEARAAGFDGILMTPPPYLRPNEDEIFEFYETVSKAIKLPLCVYNWPPGTGIDMSQELLERLANLDAVVAIKQSTGHLDRFVDTFFRLKDTVRVFGFHMNEHGLQLLKACGGDGTMGAGGVLGRDQPDFYNHLWAGDVEAARACGLKDRQLMDEWYTRDLTGIFGSGPAVLKAALNARGLPGGHVRAPLKDVSPEGQAKVRETLQRLGYI